MMMIGSALALAGKGLAIFPCLPCAKKPATSTGCKAATTDRAQIELWWRQQPDYNIGVATGRVSGMFVLDIDGLDGETSLRKLEQQHGALPASVETITGGGGRHLFFRMPDAPVRNSVGKVGDHIDVRGDGGYVVAPPSTHPNGRGYCWSVDSANVFADAPRWLIDKITPPTRYKAPTAPAELTSLVHEGVEEGQRNDTLARLAGYLLRRHVDGLVVLEILQAWNVSRCRPPLNEAEVLTVIESIAARELKRRGLR